MATRDELEAELAALKAKLDEIEDPAEPQAAHETDDPESDQPAGLDPAALANDGELHRLLSSYGISHTDIETLFNQLSHEMGELPQKKPLLTAMGALALGFVLGRMSK